MSSSIKLSEQLLYNVKLQLPFEEEINKLSVLSFSELVSELNSEAKKKTFWINNYNSFYQILALQIQDKTIFRKKIITIAGQLFSLDTIEHGILRKGKFVIGFGYFYNPFYPSFIKNLQVKTLDYRIHFALNCGAISCPPILVYELNKIESQLHLATVSFIESETTIENHKKIIETSKLFLWYKADFGSTCDIKQIIERIFHQQLKKYSIKYKPYNWTKQLNKFH